ncbi:hypothetical protein L1049_010735 [Liquidambar formosana]|uniref:O-methyltransferase C-terminal domain-containing protein n=1 Tax=Liquidambar formosana TaxID=63359 RepID=A0AAP0N833_LIQFO
MLNVLNDWDDDHCMKLLRNCWKALPNNGKVIVVEFAIPQEQGNHRDSLDAIALDFFMLVYLLGDVEHVAGDMFELLPNAQNILLKNVLHDWDDVHCMKLLRNCWKALPNNGKVIVVEFAIPQQQGNHTDSLDAIALDFFMLVYLPGGKERTTAEFDDLAKAAGFAETKFFPIAQGIYVMEFIKRSMD